MQVMLDHHPVRCVHSRLDETTYIYTCRSSPQQWGQSVLKDVSEQLHRSEDHLQYWWPGTLDDALQIETGRAG